jgi:hypothetical protein
MCGTRGMPAQSSPGTGTIPRRTRLQLETLAVKATASRSAQADDYLPRARRRWVSRTRANRNFASGPASSLDIDQLLLRDVLPVRFPEPT